MTASHRHRRGGLPIGKTVVIVLAIHALAGGGLLFLAKTQAGQEIVRTYHIKLLQPDKPPPKPKVAQEKPPPPRIPDQIKVPTPQVAQVAAVAPPQAEIGGGGGGFGEAGVNWNGGIFAGGFEGPDGAFNASVTASFRKNYHEPSSSFGSAQLQMVVTGTGQVSSFRLVRSSGNSSNDQAILAAAEKVKEDGVSAPPKGKGRVVMVRFVPY